MPDAAVVLRPVVERRCAGRVVTELEPLPGAGKLRQKHLRPDLRGEPVQPLTGRLETQLTIRAQDEGRAGERSRSVPVTSATSRSMAARSARSVASCASVRSRG